jgi:hypothetical protein
MKELGGLTVAIAVHADDSFQGVRIAYNGKKKIQYHLDHLGVLIVKHSWTCQAVGALFVFPHGISQCCR